MGTAFFWRRWQGICKNKGEPVRILLVDGAALPHFVASHLNLPRDSALPITVNMYTNIHEGYAGRDLISMHSRYIVAIALIASLTLTACGRLGLGGNRQADQQAGQSNQQASNSVGQSAERDPDLLSEGPNPRTTIFEAFNRPPPENQVAVNRYLWQASLQVLDFLPIQTVDPFTGVIVTGYGTPPGGGRAYRATVLIDDPALDARSLKVALQSRSGAVSASTVRAIEDAILTRARQLRVGDSRL